MAGWRLGWLGAKIAVLKHCTWCAGVSGVIVGQVVAWLWQWW